jgi:hypothetical protein
MVWVMVHVLCTVWNRVWCMVDALGVLQVVVHG